MKRSFRKVLLLQLLTVALIFAPILPIASASASNRAAMAAPTGVTVTPGVGQITVSWQPEPLKGVKYTVTSTPTGLACHVTDATSCTITDLSSVPYSFSVEASKSGYATTAVTTMTPPLAPHMVMVLAGQSNATGFESYAVDPDTGINYLAAPYANGADANDLITWESWDVLQGDGANPVPLDTTQSIESGQSVVNVFGPEIGIGRQLWNDQARPVTFIKTAYAGTDLGFDWSPHGSGTAPNGLYPAMVARVKSVMSADAANGQFDVLGGFYWYQGEADASRVKDAKNYQANLKAFIKAVRSDLPIAPTAPFVIAKEDCTAYFAFEYNAGEVNSATLASLQTGNSEVRAADDWAAAHLPSVVEVDSLNLPRSAPFYIHLTNVSELTIGQEMATVSEPLLP